MTTCDQCGFVYEQLEADSIGERLRAAPKTYRQAFAQVATERARKRPSPEVWSALEYLCHVRDVLLIQRDRAVLACVEERPSFSRMYRDERVWLCRYNDEEVGRALDQLAMAAELAAGVFGGFDQATWARRLIYNWPEPAEFDLAWLARHTVHEVVHHLQDVGSVLDGDAT
ncbi:MAG TPA: DinB family protein [Acidimicrobiales bacterium]|nr:DinB family protein [Acidimicrobiales bacterium]